MCYFFYIYTHNNKGIKWASVDKIWFKDYNYNIIQNKISYRRESSGLSNQELFITRS